MGGGSLPAHLTLYTPSSPAGLLEVLLLLLLGNQSTHAHVDKTSSKRAKTRGPEPAGESTVISPLPTDSCSTGIIGSTPRRGRRRVQPACCSRFLWAAETWRRRTTESRIARRMRALEVY
uniref:Putative secreted protein n=1 Tax=Anopheles marajoara TaxID=58244 RepID=A0A2M4C8D0_9DIPT